MKFIKIIRFMKRSLLSILLMMLFLIIFFGIKSETAIQSGKDIDLTKGPITFDGQWNLEYTDLETGELMSGSMSFPGIWDARKNSDRVNIPRGMGVLEKEIEIAESYVNGKELKLLIPKSFSAYRLFINDVQYKGMGIIENGSVVKDISEINIVEFTPNSKSINIRIEAYNKEFVPFGMTRSMYLGEKDQIDMMLARKLAVEVLVMLVPIALGIIFIIFYHFMKEYHYLIYFGILGITISVRSFFNSDIFLSMTLGPVDTTITLKATIMTCALALALIFMFLREVTNDQFLQKTLKRPLVGGGVYCVIAAFSTGYLLVMERYLIYFIMLTSLLFLLGYIILKMGANNYETKYFAVLIGAAMLGVILDTPGFEVISRYTDNTSIVLMFMMFIQSGLLAKKMADAYMHNKHLLLVNEGLNHELMELNNKLERKVIERTEELERISKLDNLTGVLNRHALSDAYKNELREFSRSNPVFLAICDLDDFKQINDTYGHSFGDEVLVIISSLLNEHLGDYGEVFRWGGEEFLVIIRDKSIDAAIELFDELLYIINSWELFRNELVVNVSITVGLHRYDPRMSFEENVTHSDMALYEGKSKGKNTVITSWVSAAI